ncbi:hypothetical protein BHE74_00008424, partial [Ensete ventricosum]
APPNVRKRQHKNTDKASPSGTAQTPNSVRSINWQLFPCLTFIVGYSSLWSLFGFTGVVTKSCCSDRDVRRGRASAAILPAGILAGSDSLPRPLLPPPSPRRRLHLRLPRRGRRRRAQLGNFAPLPGLVVAATWVGRN